MYKPSMVYQSNYSTFLCTFFFLTRDGVGELNIGSVLDFVKIYCNQTLLKDVKRCRYIQQDSKYYSIIYGVNLFLKSLIYDPYTMQSVL